eukprot:618783-Rhodomonas_salina.4
MHKAVEGCAMSVPDLVHLVRRAIPGTKGSEASFASHSEISSWPAPGISGNTSKSKATIELVVPFGVGLSMLVLNSESESQRGDQSLAVPGVTEHTRVLERGVATRCTRERGVATRCQCRRCKRCIKGTT